MKKFIFLLLYLLSLSGLSQQTIGFSLPKNAKKVSFKFELYNNLITVPVVINNFLTVKFILDTGAEATILTEKAFGDLVGLNYVRRIHISGPGVIDSVEAFVATGVRVDLPEEVRGQKMSMLVLKDDYLRLKENLGDEIYGIIGYDLFHRFVVEIDYDNLKLTLYDPKKYKPKRFLEEVDISLNDTKPFIESLLEQSGTTNSVKLMVDTGASHALLLDIHNTDDLSMPDKTIEARLGQGLGGEIPGMIGRLNKYGIGKYSFEEVLVSIPFEGIYSNAIKRGSRHGTVGGELLSRFNPTFDYSRGKLYLSRGKRYKKEFEFDMSGITLGVHHQHLDSLIIRKVQKNTPAAEADLRPGDRILDINGANLYNSKLSDINQILRKRDRMKINMRIKRDGVVLRKRFRLKRLI
ncbi:MAG: aspartyl protease family protein [Bacteroidota bacterium]